METRGFGVLGTGWGKHEVVKVVVVLEVMEMRECDSRPALVLMLEGGRCVALGGRSPMVTFYPDWSGLEHFTGAALDEYEMSDPAEYQLPEEWTLDGSTPLGGLR